MQDIRSEQVEVDLAKWFLKNNHLKNRLNAPIRQEQRLPWWRVLLSMFR
jgi:hypothetical protein